MTSHAVGTTLFFKGTYVFTVLNKQPPFLMNCSKQENTSPIHKA